MAAADTPVDVATNGPRQTAPPWQRWFVAASFVAVTATWCALAARHVRYGVMWSPDTGVRLEQTRAVLRGQSPVFVTPPHRDTDPDTSLHPMRAVFIQPTPRGLCYIYPPLYPLVNAGFYRALGWAGLFVTPLAAGLAVLALCTVLAFRLRLRAAPLVPIVMGVATPLVVYSTVVWDHTVQMAVAAGVGLLVWRGLQGSPFRFGALAGALLGLGIWVHGLLLILAAAVLAAMVPFARRREVRALVAGVLAGLLPALGAWLVWNAATYGSALGVHGAATAEASKVGSSAELLSIERLVRRVVVYLWGGALVDQRVAAPIGPLYLIMAFWTAAGVAFAAIRRTRVLAPACWLLAADVARRSGFLNGSSHALLQATPLLVPAVCAPLLWRPADERVRVFGTWAALCCVGFVVGVIVAPGYPGTDWGNRFCLTVLPLLFVLSLGAVEGVAATCRTPGRVAVAASAVVLVAVSAVAQRQGDVGVCARLARVQKVARAIDKEPTDVVVTDFPPLGAAVAASPSRGRLLLLRESADTPALLRHLERRGYRSLSYVGGGRLRPALAACLAGSRPPWRASPAVSGAWFDVERFQRDAGGDARRPDGRYASQP